MRGKTLKQSDDRPWRRRFDEPLGAFVEFTLFLGMERPRSIAELELAIHASPGTLEHCALRHKWQERAAKFDDLVARHRRPSEVRRAMHADASLAQEQLDRVLTALGALNLDDQAKRAAFVTLWGYIDGKTEEIHFC
jgi:hypothetical protein